MVARGKSGLSNFGGEDEFYTCCFLWIDPLLPKHDLLKLNISKRSTPSDSRVSMKMTSGDGVGSSRSVRATLAVRRPKRSIPHFFSFVTHHFLANDFRFFVLKKTNADQRVLFLKTGGVLMDFISFTPFYKTAYPSPYLICRRLTIFGCKRLGGSKRHAVRSDSSIHIHPACQ
jgi:hypothetical protein